MPRKAKTVEEWRESTGKNVIALAGKDKTGHTLIEIQCSDCECIYTQRAFSTKTAGCASCKFSERTKTLSDWRDIIGEKVLALEGKTNCGKALLKIQCDKCGNNYTQAANDVNRYNGCVNCAEFCGFKPDPNKEGTLYAIACRVNLYGEVYFVTKVGVTHYDAARRHGKSFTEGRIISEVKADALTVSRFEKRILLDDKRLPKIEGLMPISGNTELLLGNTHDADEEYFLNAPIHVPTREEQIACFPVVANYLDTKGATSFTRIINSPYKNNNKGEHNGKLPHSYSLPH